MKCIVSVIVLATGHLAAGTILYVDGDARSGGDGRSWSTAYRYLQDALADANAIEAACEIRVAQGIYQADQGRSQVLGDTQASFRLVEGVVLRGGYAGLVASEPDLRDRMAHATILSGDLQGNDHNEGASLFENSRHVVTAMNVSRATVLDGFTVTAGYGKQGCEIYCQDAHILVVNCLVSQNQAMDRGDTFGAGMFNLNSNPSLINCIFTKNRSRLDGGAIYNQGDSRPMLRDCSFRQNHAGRRGGGMYSVQSMPVLVNCAFFENEAEQYGGALCSGFQADIVVEACQFQENRALNGGAYFNEEGARFLLEDCHFVQNSACGLQCGESGFGGGLYVGSCARGSLLLDSRFNGNTAARGGGVAWGHPRWIPYSGRSGQAVVSGCVFERNRASWGGALDAGGFTLDIRNCEFTENRADAVGGAVSNFHTIMTLVNCLFAGNRASTGAGLYAHSDRFVRPAETEMIWRNFGLALENCTLAGNRSGLGQSLACRAYESQDRDHVEISHCIMHNSGDEIDNPDGVPVNIKYSNFSARPGLVYDPCQVVQWGEGNLNVDPCFVDPGLWDANDTLEDLSDDIWVNGDYHLKSQTGHWDTHGQDWVRGNVTSLCIDAGAPLASVRGEHYPHGWRINLGVYGGTTEASKSLYSISTVSRATRVTLEDLLDTLVGEYDEEPRITKAAGGYIRNIAAPRSTHFAVDPGSQATPEEAASWFLQEWRSLFVSDSEAAGFKITRTSRETSSRVHVVFRQMYAGLEIRDSGINIGVIASSGITSVFSGLLGDVGRIDATLVSLSPFIDASSAQERVLAYFTAEYEGIEPEVSSPVLLIYAPSVSGRTGRIRLVWEMEIFRESVLVDAHTGVLVWHHPLGGVPGK